MVIEAQYTFEALQYWYGCLFCKSRRKLHVTVFQFYFEELGHQHSFGFSVVSAIQDCR